MGSKTNYTIAGAFVLILSITLVIFITWLSSGFSMKHYKEYLIILNESASGLSINSSVTYNGVEVGIIKKIYLSKKNPAQVRLIVKIEKHTPITEGTTATLTSQGLTGITYLSLRGSDSNLKPIKVNPDEGYPIIQSTPSLFVRLNTLLNGFNNNMNQITENINSVLGGDNPILFKQILTNLRCTTGHLADQSKQFDKLLINTIRTTRALPLLINTLTQQTLPTTHQVLNNLTLISNNLLELTDNLNQNPALLLRGQKPLPLGPGEK